MKRANRKLRGARGFSLIEILVVVAILSIVMAVVFTQTNLVQKRNRTEESKIDLTQESREFLSLIARDLHNQGYPSKKMFGTTMVSTPPENDPKVAVGLVRIRYDEIWFEGDVDGDGQVDVIDYRLQADPNTGNCPCRISRSQALKVAGTPMSQVNNNYTMELQDVVNSGGANGGAANVAAWTITGSSVPGNNDALYAAYKTANVFTFYDASGNEVAPPLDVSTTAGKNAIATIRTIRMNVNVLARQVDMQTGMRPVMSFSDAVRVSSF